MLSASDDGRQKYYFRIQTIEKNTKIQLTVQSLAKTNERRDVDRDIRPGTPYSLSNRLNQSPPSPPSRAPTRVHRKRTLTADPQLRKTLGRALPSVPLRRVPNATEPLAPDTPATKNPNKTLVQPLK